MSSKLLKLIEESKLSKHDKQALKILYRRYHNQLESFDTLTQLHELIHYFFGDHYVQRNCETCYIHNLISDYQVEKFINEKFNIDRSEQLKKLQYELTNLGLTGEKRDLLHWDCNSCPFKVSFKSDWGVKEKSSLTIRCIKLRYILEKLIRLTLPKLYIGVIHRNYNESFRKKRVFLPTKKVRKEKLNVIVDTSTSIPLPIVNSVIETVLPFTKQYNVQLLGFSDICYPIKSKSQIRWVSKTNFTPVLEKTKNCKYNFVITDLQFDDYTPPLPKNYKVIGVGISNQYTIEVI